MRKLINTCLLALLAALSGCGGEEDPAPVNTAENPAAPAPRPEPEPPASVPVLLSHGGEFRSQPVTSISRREGGHACSLYDLSMDGPRFSLRQRVFGHHDCHGEILGEILITGVVTELQPDSGASHDFNLTVQSVTMNMRSSHWAEEFGHGHAGECAITILPEIGDMDVAGLDCEDLGHFPGHGQVFFSRYRFDGRNTLWLTFMPHEIPASVGDAADTEHPARATNLSVRYTRVGNSL